MLTGVTKERFARAVGLPWTQIIRVANRQTARLGNDETVMVFDQLMILLNDRLGEIMGLRVELERRESRARAKRMAEHARQGRYGVRKRTRP